MYLCVVRGKKYFVKRAGKRKDNSLPLVLTLGIRPDGSRTQNFTQKTD